MEQLGGSFDADQMLKKLRDGAKARALKEQQEGERIKQEVMHDFKDVDSAPFWNKCFKLIPLKTIKILLSNMEELEKDEYVIRNKPAFFINLLRKQGLFPFKEI